MWDGRRFHSLDYELKKKHHQKVYKLSLDAGCSCPNRDGTIDTRGCIFCSAGGSGDFAGNRMLSVTKQIEAAKSLVASKIHTGKYIAYFQAFTNTYGPLDRLRSQYLEAATHPDIVELSIATRPDCLSEPVLNVLKEINQIKPVTVELGLQTIHEASADFIRRGYPLPVYDKAVQDINRIGVSIVTHLILGLPKESTKDMLDSVRYVCSLPLHGIKLQLLHILRGTDLADYFIAHPEDFSLLSLPEYVDTLLACLSVIPPEIVIHRITGDGPKKLLIAPQFSADKKHVLNTIEHTMKERNFLQGQALSDGKENNPCNPMH